MKKILFIFAAMLLSSIGLQAGNTITYKATAILTGYNSSLKVGETTFGPRITSHEFSDSIGTITCAGEITKIDNNAFQRNPSLRAIEIPSSVKTIGTYAFYSCTYLRDIEIPSSVTAIGAYAFYNCASLGLVKVNWTDEQSIVPIDNTVFRQIANGAILLVPAGTVNLYRDADGWMDFSNIVDPVQITYTASAQLNRAWLRIGAVTFGSPIAAHDFSNGVGTIVCDGPITKIGMQAFLDCHDLTSIQIPNTVTAIEEQAFFNCNVLTSIAIPSSVTEIQYGAFSGCSGLTSIEIPNSVTTIEEKAFAFCTNLTSVTVNWPNAQSIVPIGDDVFQGIASDAKLYVPMGTTNLYQQANGWKNLIITASTSTFVYTASAQLTGAQFNVGATTFGPAITSHTFSNGTGMIACAGSITKIGTNAFYNCSGLTSIAIPSSVTEIQYQAFSGCTGLTSIEIPNSVTTIGQSAFYECSGLSSITIPNSVTTIGQSAFNKCSGLKSIAIPQSVTAIGDWAFAECTGVRNVKVYWEDEKSIVPINNTVFDRISGGDGPAGTTMHVPAGRITLYQKMDVWKDFGSIVVPWNQIAYNATAQLQGYNNSLEIGTSTFGPAIIDHTFSGNTGVITCAGDLTMIGDNAFRDCIDLSYVEIPHSVKSIGNNAFNNCTHLNPITISNYVSSIGEGAFYGCTALTSIVIPRFVNTIGKEAFRNCTSLSSVTLTDTPYIIEEGTFRNCTALTSIVISSSSQIGRNAFADCINLTSVHISMATSFILDYAFYNCSSLKGIYIYSSRPPTLYGNPFLDVPIDDLSVYVFDADEVEYRLIWGRKYGIPSSCIKPMPPIVVGDFKYKFFARNQARIVAKDGGYTQSEITIPREVSYMKCTFTITEIGSDAFKNSTNLTSISIPNTISKIGDAAFYSCRGLTSVTIPNSVTTIGQSAFEECKGLTSITIPTSVKEIKDWAFKNCTNLKDLQFAERARTDAITVGKYAFENLAIEDVAIPEMAVVPEGLFYSNKKLRAIYLPASVSHINQSAFEGCDSVKCVISMAATPPTLDANAFVNFKGKNDVFVYVPSANAMIAYKNSNWDSYFSNFTTDIEYRIVSTTDKTAEVVRAIPFDGKVAIPAMAVINGDYYTVIGIGKDAFKNDTLLQSISLPPSIQYIGNNAFNGCTQLKQTSIEALEDLQIIGNAAFKGCSALDSIYIPDGVQSMGKRAFMDCSSLTTVQLPGSLKIVEDSCFWGCNLQPELTIPEGVDSIGRWSFILNKSLKTVYLPSTLKKIKHGGFERDVAIKKVVCLAITPPAIDTTFAFENNGTTIYVPNRDVVAAYIASNWKSRHYNFKFADLMAEENKKYLYVVAGENDSAKAIAKLYCDSIDNYAITTTAQQVQDYTNRALEKIDKLTIVDYKQALADSLVRHAGDNAEAQLIASQYVPQIINAYFREVAERIFTEADKKIDAIFELLWLKEQYCTQLKNTAKGDPDMEKVAESYSMLIYLAETKEEARALYDRATMRMTINRQIKTDWQGTRIKVNNHECTTTRGYIY